MIVPPPGRLANALSYGVRLSGRPPAAALTSTLVESPPARRSSSASEERSWAMRQRYRKCAANVQAHAYLLHISCWQSREIPSGYRRTWPRASCAPYLGQADVVTAAQHVTRVAGRLAGLPRPAATPEQLGIRALPPRERVWADTWSAFSIRPLPAEITNRVGRFHRTPIAP